MCYFLTQNDYFLCFIINMTLKIETTKIPNTNSCRVSSYDEINLNGEIKRKNLRSFVVPADKTDEFVNKYKKTEKVSFVSMAITGLAGLLGAGALMLQFAKKHPKSLLANDIDLPAYAAVAGAIIGGAIPYQITNHKEKQILQDCNAVEIKLKK